MLNLEQVIQASDMHADIPMSTLDEEACVQRERIAIATSIVKQFLEDLMHNTLTDDTPKLMYEYPINPTKEYSAIATAIDGILYTTFQKNISVMPEVYTHVPKETEEVVEKIIIDTTMTSKCISINDRRLEEEMESFIKKNFNIMRHGNPCIFTALEISSHSFPYIYVSSRVKSISDKMQSKGYKVEWDSTSNYMLISINNKPETIK